MHDVVIVGAGTAGSVLAERLSRSGRQRVLLIEAGGAPASRFVRIPAGFAKLFKGPLDWNLESEPQQAAGGRRIFTPRGKMLGGSSNMNAQVHQWCHPADFDGWAGLGADGWSWADVAPVFRAQERWLGGDDDAARGRDGPMVVSPNRNARALSHAFVAAARAAGLPSAPGYNGGAYRGAWLCELAHLDGRRFSAYNAYLEPALRRPNLQVVTDAHATRLLFHNRRAAGVVVRRGGREEQHAAHRVVLAAGAFGSPQLLMLSGVGPASALAALGIAVRHDAPEVGANLQDHPLSLLIARTRSRDTLKKAESLPSLLRYLLFKRGMLASNGVEAFAFTSICDHRAPDLELIFVPFEWRDEGLTPPQLHAFGIAPAVVAPRSRGTLQLRSADPLAPPRIDFGLLSDPDGIDAAVLLGGVRLARRIAATAPLAGLCAGEVFPGPALESDDALRPRLHEVLQTVYHPSSTCRMGTDPGAVVDPRLRVRGVGGLWVADASVMPTVPRGHPNAVVAMIANRAAEWIAADDAV
ncbi:MAG: FAD-dependent oxidoreductase [Deltaproteobacteria bacterium]|nr:FAD-dependent oxidoreductase [Deltaproteobacteria bacterium]